MASGIDSMVKEVRCSVGGMGKCSHHTIVAPQGAAPGVMGCSSRPSKSKARRSTAQPLSRKLSAAAFCSRLARRHSCSAPCHGTQQPKTDRHAGVCHAQLCMTCLQVKPRTDPLTTWVRAPAAGVHVGKPVAVPKEGCPPACAVPAAGSCKPTLQLGGGWPTGGACGMQHHEPRRRGSAPRPRGGPS